MYDYIKGTVVELKYNSIVVDNNGIGYLIYTYMQYPYIFNPSYVVTMSEEELKDIFCLLYTSLSL